MPHRGDVEFEEHRRTRPVQPPAVLFKYTTVEAARAVLSTGKLRFQSPLRFNDPFDSQWDTLWQLSTPATLELQRMLIERALLDEGSWPPNADPKFKAVMSREREKIAALPEGDRPGAVAALADGVMAIRGMPEPLVRYNLDRIRRMRVFCLSERDDSILMWSHYADQHRGVVLGFDTDILESKLRRPVMPVKYQDDLPEVLDAEAWIRSTVFGLGDQTRLLGDPMAFVLTKFTDWGYEKEWRMPLAAEPGALGDLEDFEFPRDSIVHLIMGCRTDEVRANELRSLAYPFRPDMRYTRMTMNPASFSLLRHEQPHPASPGQ